MPKKRSDSDTMRIEAFRHILFNDLIELAHLDIGNGFGAAFQRNHKGQLIVNPYNIHPNEELEDDIDGVA